MIVLMSVCMASAKSVVFTLSNNTKVYYLLGGEKNPVMKFVDGKLVVNTDTYEFSKIKNFVISEEDFKLRGHGDLFGTKQSGDMAFKIASIKNDYKILLQAKKDSKEYLENKDTDNDELKKLLINSITTVN